MGLTSIKGSKPKDGSDPLPKIRYPSKDGVKAIPDKIFVLTQVGLARSDVKSWDLKQDLEAHILIFASLRYKFACTCDDSVAAKVCFIVFENTLVHDLLPVRVQQGSPNRSLPCWYTMRLRNTV